MNQHAVSVFEKDNLAKFLSVNCYYQTIYQNYSMCIHFHERLEIMYVNFGEVEIEYYDSEDPQKPSYLTLLSHDYVLIDLNVPHTIRVRNLPSQILNLELSLSAPPEHIPLTLGLLGKSDENFRKMMQNRNRGRVFKLFDQNNIYSQILLIQSELNRKEHKNCELATTQLALAVLMLYIAKDYSEQKLSSSGIETVYVKKATQFIDAYYQNKISNAEICEYAGISQNYLNQLFHKQYGKTMNEYLNRHRIKKSKILIANSNLNFSQISEQVGYRTKQNFNKNFLKYEGISPKQYRNQINTATEIHWNENSANTIVFNSEGTEKAITPPPRLSRS